MCKALGIVNLRRDSIEGIGDYRPLGATSFMGRYRLVDFVLSNMANSGMDNIQVYIKDKPRSLIEHIGDGRQYNMNSKRGRINLLGGERRLPSDAYNTDINAFVENMRFIEKINMPYVVIAPCNFIYLLDYNDLIQYHVENGADITMVYKNVDTARDKFLGCDVVNLDSKKDVVSMEVNRGTAKSRTISLETYVMSLEVFKKLVKSAQETSAFYTLRDIIADSLDSLHVAGYAYKGYAACVNSLQAYYDASMDLKKPEVISKFMHEEWPIYTKTNDSAPTKYGEEAIVKNSCIANGCIIKGTVINSVIGRGVTIEENAVVKDCIILADTYVSKNTHVEYAVVDKLVKIKQKNCIKGDFTEPVYIKKYDTV